MTGCRHLPRTQRIYLPNGGFICSRCGLTIGDEKVRRGRTARQRGNAFQAMVAQALGVQNMGPMGLPHDYGNETDLHRGQAKKDARLFPTTIWKLLQSFPAGDDQLRSVVLSDVPGSGNRARIVIAFDFRDFVEWYGRG